MRIFPQRWPVAGPYDWRMPEESVSRTSRGERARRLVISVGVGAGTASAIAAIGSAITMWALRSPRDYPSQSLTGHGVVAVVTGACVLVLLVSRLFNRCQPVRIVGVLAGCAAGLAAWDAWARDAVSSSNEALPFMDSTGATVVCNVATMAAVTSAVLGLATATWAHTVSARAAVCAFLVAVVGIPGLAYRSVEDYRATIWHPELTAEAVAPAAVPDAIGPVRYRIPIDNDDHRTHIFAAGNGFIIDTGEQLTAYDGETGAKRWQVDGYGVSRRVLMVQRAVGDTAGIVVLFQAYGVIALDGSSGEVLWRRQYTDGGKVTAATGGTDALGMTVFTADSAGEGPQRTRTRLYSLDPATGQVRFAQPISCSDPTLDPGTPGQFTVRCGTVSIIDARTGIRVDVPSEYTPLAGTDAYLIRHPRLRGDPTPTDVTRVVDPNGRVLDEVPGTRAVSSPCDGYLLLYNGGETWVLRDYRNHRSMRVPLHVSVGSDLSDVEAHWLRHKMLVTNPYNRPRQFDLVDPTRPSDSPVTAESPCPPRRYQGRAVVAVGAIIVPCAWDEVIGLVPNQS